MTFSNVAARAAQTTAASAPPGANLPSLVDVQRATNMAREMRDTARQAGYAQEIRVWVPKPRAAHLAKIEQHVVEAVICNPGLIAPDFAPHHVKNTRSAIEEYLGHKIESWVWYQKIPKAGKEALQRLLEGEGIKIPKKAYKTLRHLLFALAEKSHSGVKSDEPPVPESVEYAGKTYKVHRKGTGRPFIKLRVNGKATRICLDDFFSAPLQKAA